MRAVTARRKLQTAAPLGVKVTSGSSVRLPVMVTWVSGMAVPSSGAQGWCWLVGRGGGPVSWLVLLPGRVGQLVPAGVGLPGVVRHGPRLLPAGRAQVLARPGRPVSPGRLDAGVVKGPPKAERALMSAQRPLTAEAARWQPVQQANGRDVRGRGAVGVPARQRSVKVVPRRQPACLDH